MLFHRPRLSPHIDGCNKQVAITQHNQAFSIPGLPCLQSFQAAWDMSCNRIVHNASEACTTVPPTANYLAGAAYAYTVTRAYDNYGRCSSIHSAESTCTKPQNAL
eukprot:6198070-Pleurochrysis_carterae.AAC.2